MKKKLPPITHEFTIKDSLWIHADENGNSMRSALLLDNGKMCCLGFYARSCRLKPRQILDIADPATLADDGEALPEQFERTTIKRLKNTNLNQRVVDQLIKTNDKGAMALEKRKDKITKLFQKMGVGVMFIPENKKRSKKT
jgi:hypothetical protein